MNIMTSKLNDTDNRVNCFLNRVYELTDIGPRHTRERERGWGGGVGVGVVGWKQKLSFRIRIDKKKKGRRKK